MLRTGRSLESLLKESMKKILRTKTWRGKSNLKRTKSFLLSNKSITWKVQRKTMTFLWSRQFNRSKILSKRHQVMLKTIKVRKWSWIVSSGNSDKRLFELRIKPLRLRVNGKPWKKITTNWKCSTTKPRMKFWRQSMNYRRSSSQPKGVVSWSNKHQLSIMISSS